MTLELLKKELAVATLQQKLGKEVWTGSSIISFLWGKNCFMFIRLKRK